MTGRSSAWLERLVWDQEVEGSNPFAPITLQWHCIPVVVALTGTGGKGSICFSPLRPEHAANDRMAHFTPLIERKKAGKNRSLLDAILFSAYSLSSLDCLLRSGGARSLAFCDSTP